jgi:hypothetical protein
MFHLIHSKRYENSHRLSKKKPRVCQIFCSCVSICLHEVFFFFRPSKFERMFLCSRGREGSDLKLTRGILTNRNPK